MVSSERFVAAMTRTSTLISRVPPTRLNIRSCRQRSTLAWLFGDISPTSSRNSVPRSASSMSPFLVARASVKAPFSWPNSSLSKSVSVMAAQLTSMNGKLRRALS